MFLFYIKDSEFQLFFFFSPEDTGSFMHFQTFWDLLGILLDILGLRLFIVLRCQVRRVLSSFFSLQSDFTKIWLVHLDSLERTIFKGKEFMCLNKYKM